MSRARFWLATALMFAGCSSEDEIPLQPTLSAFPESVLEFPDRYIGTSQPLSLQLRNAGQGTLSIQSVEKSGDGAFSLVQPAPSSQEVAYDKTAFVQVIFAPTEAKEYSGSLHIVSNAGNTPDLTVTLKGKGVSP
jgi:hypothetical protein